MKGGKRIGAGRPGGIPNRVTHDLREVLHQFASEALNDFPKLFKGLESDKERLDVLIRLLPYVAPRLQTIALVEPVQKAEPLTIKIVYDKQPPFASDEEHIDFDKAR